MKALLEMKPQQNNPQSLIG